jgi:hypothetical protein
MANDSETFDRVRVMFDRLYDQAVAEGNTPQWQTGTASSWVTFDVDGKRAHRWQSDDSQGYSISTVDGKLIAKGTNEFYSHKFHAEISVDIE